MGSATIPSTCYILSDESGVPLCSTRNKYKKYMELITLHKTKMNSIAWSYNMVLQKKVPVLINLENKVAFL